MASEPALAAVLRATTLESSGADTHDAIIVGAGAAGGLAAMLLAQSGLRVLVLDASLPVQSRAPLQRLAGGLVRRLSTHEKLNFLPPTLIPKARTALRILGKWRQPVQSLCYAWQWSPNAYVDDRDCPYVTPPDRPFVWVRARILGGRVAVPRHGKQYYRLGSDDFLPNDGLSTPWPFQPHELDSWYTFVERKLKLSGMCDNLPWLPDSELADVLSFTESEEALRDKIIHRWPGARPILSRYAPPLQTLEAAAQTGRLQCRQGAIVREIRVDDVGCVNGVAWIDHHTRTQRQSSAPLVFLCASALEFNSHPAAVTFPPKLTRARCGFGRFGTPLDGPCGRKCGRSWSPPIFWTTSGRWPMSLSAAVRCARSRQSKSWAWFWSSGLPVACGRRTNLFLCFRVRRNDSSVREPSNA